MLRVVAEMNIDLETFKKLHIPPSEVCPMVTTEECDSESSCYDCALKYSHRLIRIISVDNVGSDKI